MNEKSKDDLDHMMQQVIRHKYENSPKPLKSAEDAWKEIQHELDIEHSSKSRYKSYNRVLSYVAIIVVLVVVLLISNPSNSFAFNKFTNIFHKVKGSVLQVFTKIGDDEANIGSASQKSFRS